MRLVNAAVGIADASGELVGRQEAVGFDDPSLAMGPGGLSEPMLLHVLCLGVNTSWWR